MAGILGIDPGPFTARQLLAMADGKAAFEWAQTSLLASVIHNSQLTDPSQAKPPIEFNLYERQKQRPDSDADVIPGDISVLKVFLPTDSGLSYGQ